jgi:hypothetical protein
MKAKDCVQFRSGPYKSPSIPIGTIIACESRDADVILVDYSDAKIPWPIGRRPRLGAKSLIVFGEVKPQSSETRKKMSISQMANRGPNKTKNPSYLMTTYLQWK